MKVLEPIDFALISSNVPDSSYPVWDSTTSYTAGTNVYVTDNHGEYQALTDNTNSYPPTNPSDWQWLGTTNRWKMFDQYLNTYTENPNTIEIEISAYLSQGFFIGNISGQSLQVEVIDNTTSDVIESKTISLIRNPKDWLDYFCGNWDKKYKKSYMYYRETLNSDVTYRITLDAGDGTAKIGVFAIGMIDEIGLTLYNINLSALDYSQIYTDQNTGATYLSQGNYVKTLELDVFAPTNGVDEVYRTLTDIRGKPVVFLGDNRSDDKAFETLNVYGYMKKFETLLKSMKETHITLSIQGLI